MSAGITPFRRAWWFSAAMAFLPALPAAEPPLPAAAASIEQLRMQLEAQVDQPRFAPALWGVKIVSLDSGRTLFEHHADRLLSPASNSKLYTGAMALDQLGPDYRIVTPIHASTAPDAAGTVRGDVIVGGRGDPSWKSAAGRKDFARIFEPFVAALRSAGVRRVTGDLVADATFFRGVPNGAGWTADDLNDYYGAEVSAITLEDNYVELRVLPAAKPGEPCTLTLLQSHTGLVLDNRTTTGLAGTERKLEATRIYGENIVHLFGSLPAADKEEVLDVTVPRPATWFAAALKEALAQTGIAVDGAARSVRWPEPPPVTSAHVKIGEITSAPLRELIVALMKPSQNLETDLIFDHLGEMRRTPATPPTRTSEECGVIALRDFLKQRNLPVDDVRFEEGSGLSRNNLTTANATVALLQFMATHPAAADFQRALPIAGVDGTLKKRMKGTAAEGNVRAKTGSLRYANSLSGYVTTAAGERLAFSLMLNRNVQPTGRNVREELDDIAVMLARLAVRTEPSPAPIRPASQ
jgi:D-alanyl-D-alanine carboxypeptidase/D-alanyl-D-alanine-endopeptidase (penicillin-binding protein 4)